MITLLLSFKFEKEESSDRDVIGKTEENAAENIEANTNSRRYSNRYAGISVWISGKRLGNAVIRS